MLTMAISMTSLLSLLLVLVAFAPIRAFLLPPPNNHHRHSHCFDANNNGLPKLHNAREATVSTSSSQITPPLYHHYNSTLPPLTSQLRHLQSKHYASIISTFQPDTSFHPLFSNKHLQTVGGVFLRHDSDCAYVDTTNLISTWMGVVRALFNIQSSEYMNNPVTTTAKTDDWYYDERERVVTPGGGAFFTVDHKYYNPNNNNNTTEASSKGTVIIIHGLESNSNSSLCIDMSRAYLSRGYDVSVLNFRGCCGTNVSSLYDDGTLIMNGENSLMYHLGFVDDLIYYLSLLEYRHSNSNTIGNDNDNNNNNNEKKKRRKPIYLSGFSLGANVILKALGQLGSDATLKYNVHGASVAGAPFDTERNYLQFHEDPISRTLYVTNLLNKLKRRAEDILRIMYGNDVSSAGFDYVSSINAETIYELESSCVAPLFGFKDHLDYYRQTSCGYYLHRISVPTYIVNAKDDPFFDSGYVPWDKVYGGEKGGENGDISSITDDDNDDCSGGPIQISFTEYGGHLGYIFHQTNDKERKRKASWISEELARFIGHAHDKLFTEEDVEKIVSVPSSLPLV